MATDKLLGRITSGTGAIEEIPHASLAEMQACVQTALRGMSPSNIGEAINELAITTNAGAVGEVLTSDGTDWISAPLPSSAPQYATLLKYGI